jgi:hypothetical protein
MSEVSLPRLYVLRAMYLFIVAGLGIYLWPGILDPNKRWELMQGHASCMLAAFSLALHLGVAISAADAPRAALGSDLEDALAPHRSVAAVVVGPRR